jgi:hypothetical protein
VRIQEAMGDWFSQRPSGCFTPATRDLFLLALEEGCRTQCKEPDVEAKGHSNNGANGDVRRRVVHSENPKPSSRRLLWLAFPLLFEGWTNVSRLE